MHPDEQVITGEAVAVDMQLAGVGSRGIAALIDYVVATAGLFVVLFVVFLIGPGGNDDTLGILVLVVAVGVQVGYPVAMETLWRGRTLGKAWLGLRVVRDDGGPIRFRHAFVRGLVGTVLDKPGISVGLAALIPMLATNRHKRLGDLAAGTIVLQERVPGKIDAPVAMPPALAWWAASLDLSTFDDALALRIRQFLGRASQLSPAARATLEHQLTTDVVARVGPPPPDAPAWAIITAVLAERRRRAFDAMQPASQPGWNQPATYASSPYQPAPPPPATSEWTTPVSTPFIPQAAPTDPYIAAPSARAKTAMTANSDDTAARPVPPSTTGFAPPA